MSPLLQNLREGYTNQFDSLSMYGEQPIEENLSESFEESTQLAKKSDKIEDKVINE